MTETSSLSSYLIKMFVSYMLVVCLLRLNKASQIIACIVISIVWYVSNQMKKVLHCKYVSIMLMNCTMHRYAYHMNCSYRTIYRHMALNWRFFIKICNLNWVQLVVRLVFNTHILGYLIEPNKISDD